jgi:HD-like signal output (HDOD) protein
MESLTIDKLKPEMVLAEDVKDMGARLLLSKGSKIQNEHIKMFRMWGIGEVAVVGNMKAEQDSSNKSDPVLMEKIAGQLKRQFKMNDLRHPIIKEIFAASVLYRSKSGNIIEFEPPQALPEAVSPTDIRTAIKKRNIKLPEIPSIVYELNEVIADPFSSANDIAVVVSKSPSLASLLLKMVNSAFYGFPSKIDSIARAVALIGSKEISALGLGISTMELFNEIPKDLVDVKAFFKHCLACGTLSRIIAVHFNVQHTEQLFVSGLLHDIGRVIIFKYFPRHAQSLIHEAYASGDMLYNLEPGHLGCRHTHIGRDLLNKWKLPYSLENITYYHHMPSRAADPQRAGVVHLADICVHGLGLGTSGEPLIPPLDEKACEALKATPGILKSALRQGLHQLNVLETIFEEGS